MPEPREPLELHAFWKRLGVTPLPLVIGLFVALGALRVYGYFGGEMFSGHPIMIGFVIMWFLPILFLSPHGRYQIGLGHKVSIKWLLLAIFAGAACSLFSYILGIALYGKSEENWFVSVALTYQSDFRLAELPRHIAFIAFTVPAILASPVGEELFFRGMIETSTRDRLSPLASASIAAGLFALIHLTHHGVYRGYDAIRVMPVSGFLWLLLMFATSLAFSFLRRKGSSIWTPIAAHAAFNLVMNVTIFYSLFVTEPQTAYSP